MIVIAALLVAVASAPPKATMDVDRTSIREAVVRRHEGAHVDAIFIHGDYALAAGRMAAGPLHDGLHLTHAGWRVVCSFPTPPTSLDLRVRCDFPSGIATEIAANESAQFAAEQGNFTTALAEQKQAYASASAPERDEERARVQLLAQLNNRMRLGLMTRQQAIREWNSFRLTWLLPGL